MKKTIYLAAVLALVASICVGCAPAATVATESTVEATATAQPAETATEEATSAATDGPVIAYICKDLSQQWFLNVSSALQETATSLGASKVLLIDVAMDPEDYLIALDNVISQGVGCIVVCAPDQDLSKTTVDKCAEAGIPVIAESDPLIDENGKLLAPAIVMNGYQCGLDIGTWLGNYMVDNKISTGDETGYLCMTMTTVSNCIPRHEGAVAGFKSIVPDYPDDRIFYSDYDGTAETAFDAAAATITAHPEIKVWISTAPNDEGSQGVCRALEQVGLSDNAVIVGMGGYVASDEFAKGTVCFKASGYINGKTDGDLVAKAAMEWINTGKAPWQEYIGEGETFGECPFGATIITPDNYKEIMGIE